VPVKTREKPKFPDIIKGESASVTDKYAKYMPSKAEIATIANLIERITGMEVDDRLKNGKVKVRLVTADEGLKIRLEELRSALRESINPKFLEKIEQRYAEAELKTGRDATAFFSQSKDTIFLIGDAIEQKVKELCETESIGPDSPVGRRIEKYAVLSACAHELAHKVTDKNSPEIRKTVGFKGMAEESRILWEMATIKDKDPERFATLDDRLNQYLNRTHAMNICDEGISYYIERKVMCELGYADWVEAHLMMAVMSITNTDRDKRLLTSMVLLDTIEKKIQGNPVAFIIRNPPNSLEEIDEMMK